ncbi:uncharacterized protein BDR25DRAFT_131989 [Lindgomyces ingoldianus]|uniref:Uncharacterized protein n=1 Tax=Lindgomyces ingoldianus TaxID=673940 RepID=A0ACB6R2E4_9PLEO|nr:uncharacterized protein BDR25DRAFT_131989 [Lindgomyces ingoldianus]KAF2473428.1 hypothetical protein BDR25DRAFT_131989 [Lindgomyces ingoldianus]
MCMRVVRVFRGCSIPSHAELLGFDFCSMDHSFPEHRLEYYHAEDSGFPCPACEKVLGNEANPNGVHWYAPVDLVIKPFPTTGKPQYFYLVETPEGWKGEDLTPKPDMLAKMTCKPKKPKPKQTGRSSSPERSPLSLSALHSFFYCPLDAAGETPLSESNGQRTHRSMSILSQNCSLDTTSTSARRQPASSQGKTSESVGLAEARSESSGTSKDAYGTGWKSKIDSDGGSSETPKASAFRPVFPCVTPDVEAHRQVIGEQLKHLPNTAQCQPARANTCQEHRAPWFKPSNAMESRPLSSMGLQAARSSPWAGGIFYTQASSLDVSAHAQPNALHQAQHVTFDNWGGPMNSHYHNTEMHPGFRTMNGRVGQPGAQYSRQMVDGYYNVGNTYTAPH